jgi:hypothetical protein
VSRILLDQNAPRGLRRVLSDHEVKSAYELGWAEISNGMLLGAAEQAGFDIFITADGNIRSQQNMSGRRIAMVVLSTNNWLVVREHTDLVVNAIAGAGQGAYVTVTFPRPPLRRRHRPSEPTI